jgi:hypothetical protein
VTIETHELPYDPLDEEGYQRIERGDYVNVTAHLESDFFEGQEIVAAHITTLYDDSASRRADRRP